MSDLGNKEIMARNIRFYMEKAGVTQTELCNTLGFKMPTFSDWVHAKTYPRIDKIELMANYFGISKADLVEKRSSRPIIIERTGYEGSLLSQVEKLNARGREKLLSDAQEMTCNPLYNDDYMAAVAAHERTDVNVTDEMKKHDDDIMNDDSKWE